MDEVKAEETNELLLDSVDKQRVHSPLVLFNFDMNEKAKRALACLHGYGTPPHRPFPCCFPGSEGLTFG